MHWHGVIPAITTPFRADGSVDHDFLAKHCRWLIENRCTGVVALGSLGEGSTLKFEEKIAILETAVKSLGKKAPVIAGISALSTAEAVDLAQAAQAAGCQGLMVLPPYIYVGDWREMKAHVAAILSATSLSCMLYNNPIAYQVDFLPEQVAELVAGHRNLQAIKESSADVRRITEIKCSVGEKLKILCGVDDLILEAVYAGATGWIAGLANAFPGESVDLFELAEKGEREAAFELYRRFLPLLRLDTVPKFVQLIKYVQELVGMGSGRMRAPRLELSDEEKESVRRTVSEYEHRHAARAHHTH
ncbi:MAG: dihydrodipicolinate synthase family protein [Acidobacteriaceae bacterium]|nr:dihydrodipicolinate synthase family protein [Acidobacteriaceae bacterium]MBV9294756.1 dihydrodipicolinate synthase family protein [Acidobacteriaceae bacterium]